MMSPIKMVYNKYTSSSSIKSAMKNKYEKLNSRNSICSASKLTVLERHSSKNTITSNIKNISEYKTLNKEDKEDLLEELDIYNICKTEPNTKPTPKLGYLSSTATSESKVLNFSKTSNLASYKNKPWYKNKLKQQKSILNESLKNPNDFIKIVKHASSSYHEERNERINEIYENCINSFKTNGDVLQDIKSYLNKYAPRKLKDIERLTR